MRGRHPAVAMRPIAMGLALVSAIGCGPSEQSLQDTLPKAPPRRAPNSPQPSATSAPPPTSAPPATSAPAPAPQPWVVPGATLTRPIKRDDVFLAGTNIPSAWAMDIAAQYTAQVYVSRGDPGPSGRSLMMVFGAEGANVAALPAYIPIADARGLIVVAVNGYQHTDNGEGRSHEDYYCALKFLDDLQKDGTLAANAAYLLAGFSGGAKMAMIVGVYGGRTTFRGVIAGGCNEDLASYALGMLYNPSALALPFVLVNATDDSIVGGSTPNVTASLMQSGFSHVLVIPYTGGHSFPPVDTMKQAVDSILAIP